jgi:amino acid adenylation domain-containing protein
LIVSALTSAEADLHLAHLAADDPTAYQAWTAYRLHGPFRVDLLQSRLEQLVDAQPRLRSTIAERDGGWYFEPAGRPHLHFSASMFDSMSPTARSQVARECRRLLDPSGPLFRAVLLTYSDDIADLIVVAHHVIVDAPAMDLVVRALLLGEIPAPAASPPVAEPPTERVNEARTALASADTVLDWTWSGGTARRSTAGADTEWRITPEDWTRVRELAAAAGGTPQSVVLTAAALVVARNSGVQQPVIGTTVSRRRPRDRSTVAYRQAMALVPVDTTAAGTVLDRLHAVHRQAVASYRRADVPLSAVLPAGSRAPEVVVVPVTARPEIVDGPLRCVPHPDRGLGTAQFPLTLYLHHEPDGGVRALLRFQHSKVTRVAAELFGRQLTTVLTAFARQPGVPLADVSTVADVDRARVVRLASGPPLDPPRTDLAALVARRAAAHPDRPALVHGDTRLSYRELDRWSSTLAFALLEEEVRPGDRVGVLLDRGPGQIAAALAVLKAGAAYVPLDPAYPAERIDLLIRGTGARLVVGDRAGAVGGARVLPVTATAGPRPLPPVDPDGVAYVIHTSGSSGRPKPVMVAHRNVVSLLTAVAQGAAPTGPDDVWTYFHSFSFDFSVWEIWGCLTGGGCLVVVPADTARDPEALHDLLVAQRVTVLSQTPSAFAQLVQADTFQRGGLAVRLLVLGGEALDPRLLLPFFDRYPAPACRALNMYGITETTVHCTWHPVSRADALAGSRAVGRPLPGWALHVLDEAGRPAAPGVPGEIHVGGAGVAAGYLGQPELTAQRFVTDTVTGAPGLLYRTGDRGRYTHDGVLEHLGRLDQQVKIRGHRIELGEVESALRAHPAVDAAAAVVRQHDDAASARIDAYVVGPDQRDCPDIRRWLTGIVPAHVVPASVTAVAGIPLTANGKVAVRELPEPRTGPTAPRDDGPAASGHVHDVVRVWQQVLGTAVGPDDNFFDLGGNSLLAVQLHAALRRHGFAGVQLRDVLRHHTPRRLTEAIGQRTASTHTLGGSA